MKILFAASECVPFCKTGGLADVVGALAPVLAKKGNDVRVMLPLYQAVPREYVEKLRHVVDFEVEMGWRRQYCGIEALEMNGVTFYFVDNKYYFGRSYLYGLGGDEHERFGFFCRAVLNSLPLLQFQPQIIHAHDWQTGMIPALLKIQYQHLPFFAPIRTVFTIHNLQYQGIFGIPEVQDILGLDNSLFTNDKLECFGSANFMKAGLVYADEITTVSPSYAEEIQTSYYGERMDGCCGPGRRIFLVCSTVSTWRIMTPLRTPRFPRITRRRIFRASRPVSAVCRRNWASPSSRIRPWWPLSAACAIRRGWTWWTG